MLNKSVRPDRGASFKPPCIIQSNGGEKRVFFYSAEGAVRMSQTLLRRATTWAAMQSDILTKEKKRSKKEIAVTVF